MTEYGKTDLTSPDIANQCYDRTEQQLTMHISSNVCVQCNFNTTTYCRWFYYKLHSNVQGNVDGHHQLDRDATYTCISKVVYVTHDITC